MEDEVREAQDTNTEKKVPKKVNKSKPRYVVLPKECVSCGSSKVTSLGQFREPIPCRGYDKVEFHRVQCGSCDRVFNQRRQYPVKEPKNNARQES